MISSGPSIKHIQLTASSSAASLHLMHSWCIIHATSSTPSQTATVLTPIVFLAWLIHIIYNGGLFCSLLCDDNPQFKKKYPPGTQVECINPITNILVSGTFMDILFPVDVSDSSEDKMDLPYTCRRPLGVPGKRRRTNKHSFNICSLKVNQLIN